DPEVRDPRSDPEVRSRDPESEVRDPKSEVRSPKSEVRDPKSEVRDPKSDVGIGHRTSDLGPRDRTSDSDSDTQVPEAWQRIVTALHEAQPALGAVLEHGVPVQVSAQKLVLSFPEGSFFGRQAQSDAAQQALLEAAARVLGQRPAIEIGVGLQSRRPTVAAQE